MKVFYVSALPGIAEHLKVKAHCLSEQLQCFIFQFMFSL